MITRIYLLLEPSAKRNFPLQVLYAVALVPAGFLADRTDRPRMLAGGLAVWSVLTMAASKASIAHSPMQSL